MAGDRERPTRYTTSDVVGGPATEAKQDIGNASLSTIESTVTAGLLPYRNIDLDETGQVVKASAGKVYGYYFYNNNAGSARFIKIYNKATAPTAGDTPVLTIPLPAGAAANVITEKGIAFSAGISLRATTGVADADTGAPATNDVVVNVYYI